MARKKAGSVLGMQIRDYISGQRIQATPEELEAVQPFARRLVEDLGYSRQQVQTRPQFMIRGAPSGSPKWPVDIAVFPDEQRDHGSVYMIVECKQPTRRDGYDQLVSYLNLCPASLGVWFNGNEHLYLHKEYHEGTPTYVEIASLPKNGERVEDMGRHLRRQLVNPFNLRAQFRDIRNHLAGSARGVTRDEPIAAQLINILFCKIHDELTTAPSDSVRFRVSYDESPEGAKRRLLELFDEVKTEYNDVFSPNESLSHP